MHPSMAKLPSAEDASLAFAEVATAIGYLHARGGMAALRTAIGRWATGSTRARRWRPRRAAAGREFERGWRAFMPPSTTRRSRLRHPDHAHPQGRRHRLAAEARARTRRCRRRLKAAADALSAPREHVLSATAPAPRCSSTKRGTKAVGHAGQRPQRSDGGAWLFPVKLGRTYLALGEPDRALKALAPVQALYPDLPWPNLIAGEARLAQGDAPGAVAPCARRWPPTPSTRASTARWPPLTKAAGRPAGDRRRRRPRAEALQRAGRRIGSRLREFDDLDQGAILAGLASARCRTSVKTNGGRFDEKAPTPVLPRWSRTLRGHSRLRADRAATTRHRTASKFGAHHLGGRRWHRHRRDRVSLRVDRRRVVYDQSMFHIEGLLGYRHSSRANNGGSDSTFQFGVAGWYHLARGANADFSIGGSVGLLMIRRWEATPRRRS